MSEPGGNRLATILWFVAAALAFIAVGIPFLDGRKPNWGAGAAGLFCLVMGIASLRQKGAPPSA